MRLLSQKPTSPTTTTTTAHLFVLAVAEIKGVLVDLAVIAALGLNLALLVQALLWAAPLKERNRRGRRERREGGALG